MKIYCCGCTKKVQARLTNGVEIYPHRKDLGNLPFWICDICSNYVGCHYKTKNRTRPLGVIPTPEIKKARQNIHRVIDPIWRSGRVRRNKLYSIISERVGWNYHTANIRTIEEVKRVYKTVVEFKRELDTHSHHIERLK